MSTDTLDELRKAGFVATETSISKDVDNTKIQQEVDNSFNSAVEIIEKNQPDLSKELIENKPSITSSWFGYPVGGTATIKFKGNSNTNDVTFTVKSKSPITLNDSLTDKNEITFDSDKLKKENIVKYNVRSIKSLRENIYQLDDNKNIRVEYIIAGTDDFNPNSYIQTFNNNGYYAESQGGNNIKLVRNFKNTMDFNSVFNLDNLNMFGVIGNVNITEKNSIEKKFNVTGKISKTEGIGGYSLGIYTNKDSTEYKYANKPIEINIESKNMNIGTIAIALICIFSIITVIVILRYMHKNGYIDKFKD